MIDEFEVREKLEALQNNDIPLVDFENWLASASRNMHNDSSRNAIDLVSSIHVLLSERDDHIIDEGDLRLEFLALMDNKISEFLVFSDKEILASQPLVVFTASPVYRVVPPQPWALPAST